MNSNMIGMDTAEGRALANSIRSQAGHINSVTSAIDGIVHQMANSWRGQDAIEFVGWWQQKHRPALVAVTAAVSGLAQSIDNRARAQDEASAATGSGSGPSNSAPPATPGTKTAQPTSTAPAFGDPTQAEHAYQSGAGLHSSTASWAQGPPANGNADQWGNAANNCTSWAAFRRSELGLSIPHGNGVNMADSIGLAPNLSAVHQGSLVSYPSADDSFGHVMVVEKVISTNPPHLVVSEMNYDWHGSISVNTSLTQNPDGSWTKVVEGHSPQTVPAPQFST